MTDEKENIGTKKEAQEAKRGLNKARLQTIQDKTPELPPVPPSSRKTSDNLTQQEQPGAAQLYRKLQNRLSRRQAQNAPDNLTQNEQPGATQLLKKYQNQMRKSEMINKAQRLMPVISSITAGKSLSEIAASSKEADEIMRDTPENPMDESDEPSVLLQTIKSLGTVAEKENYLTAVTQGIKTGIMLRRNVETHRNETYLAALFLALIKDLIDVAAIELASWADWLVDLTILIILRIFLFWRGTWKVRLALWIIGPLEMIPVFGALPGWTCCVLYAWHKSWKKARDSKEQLSKLNEKMAELKAQGGGKKKSGHEKKKDVINKFEEIEKETSREV